MGEIDRPKPKQQSSGLRPRAGRVFAGYPLGVPPVAPTKRERAARAQGKTARYRDPLARVRRRADQDRDRDS